MGKTLRFSGPQRELFDGRWEPVPISWIDNRRQYEANVLRTAQPVTPGRYVVRMTIAATYSSYKYFAKTVESPVEL
jgi:hypothetical protein